MRARGWGRGRGLEVEPELWVRRSSTPVEGALLRVSRVSRGVSEVLRTPGTRY